ncbi:DUF3592 domain-containing protein [Paraburkholderia sp. J67]|uniref:DUF3592 domain-containing protein n=1 Tax=Paraburkholderia sp. J67 TaxID=2805435 RepID=UPI002ABD2985|nr:DUF3592 domain-containing protein [Paraburkholderia sp. J67]
MNKAIVMFFVGIALLLIAVFAALSTRHFLQTAIAVPGQVVSLNAGGSHPQIEFVTRTGDRISYPQGGMIFGMKVGDKVTVLYRPEAPSIRPTIDRIGAVWGAELTLLFIGFVTMVGALTNLPSRKKET